MKYRIQWNGATKTMKGWCRTLHISESFFSRRYGAGMDVGEIIEAHRRAKDKRLPVPGRDETLCWTCTRDGRTCPWLRNETPVAGWVADATVKHYYDNDTRTLRHYDSFMIHKCPLYVRRESEACEESEEQEPGA